MRLKQILTMLNVATHPGQLNASGLRLHPLKGKPAGCDAVSVDENFHGEPAGAARSLDREPEGAPEPEAAAPRSVTGHEAAQPMDFRSREVRICRLVACGAELSSNLGGQPQVPEIDGRRRGCPERLVGSF